MSASRPRASPARPPGTSSARCSAVATRAATRSRSGALASRTSGGVGSEAHPAGARVEHLDPGVQVLLPERPAVVARVHAVGQSGDEAGRDAGGAQQQHLGGGELLAEADPVDEQEAVDGVLARCGHRASRGRSVALAASHRSTRRHGVAPRRCAGGQPPAEVTHPLRHDAPGTVVQRGSGSSGRVRGAQVLEGRLARRHW